MTITERRQRVWEYMKVGIAASNIAEVLGVHHRTIRDDMQWLRNEMLRLGLQLGDWVEIKLTSSTFLCGHGKAGVLTQIRLSQGDVAVDFDPFRKHKHSRNQLFRIDDVRKLNGMEVLAKVSS